MKVSKDIVVAYYSSSNNKYWKSWHDELNDEIQLVDLYGQPIQLNKIYFRDSYIAVLLEISSISVCLSEARVKTFKNFYDSKRDSDAHVNSIDRILINTNNHTFYGKMLENGLIQLPIRTYEDLCIEELGTTESQE